MSDIYGRTSDGSDSDSGLDWTNAKSTATGMAAAMAVGSFGYFSDNFASTSASSTTYTFPGTVASPNKLISANDSGDPVPPTASLAGASVELTGSANLTVNGSFYCYGMTWRSGVGTSTAVTTRFNNGDQGWQVYETCKFEAMSTGAARIDFGVNSSGTETSVMLRDSTFKFNAITHTLGIFGSLTMNGGGLASGCAAITNFISAGATEGVNAAFSGIDLSLGAAAMNLIASAIPQTGQIMFRNIKLPASWTGGLFGGKPASMGLRGILHNGSSGSTVYPLWEEDYAGKVVHEATIKKTNGPVDGPDHSWKLTNGTGASYPTTPFRTCELPPFAIGTVSVPVTVYVDILHDGATALTDADISLDLMYPVGTGALTTRLSTAKADVLAATTNYPAGDATWVTTGLTTPNVQRMSLTFTPGRAGVVQGSIRFFKTSGVAYIAPLIVEDN